LKNHPILLAKHLTIRRTVLALKLGEAIVFWIVTSFMPMHSGLNAMALSW
jgi:hypothetical protein